MFRFVSCIMLAVPLLMKPAFAQHAANQMEMTAPSEQGAGKEMMEEMAKMDHDMSAAPMTGDPDHDFVAMMIPHHQGAIDMAQTELRYGKDAVLRHLAREIIVDQKREIALMQKWQASHPSH